MDERGDGKENSDEAKMSEREFVYTLHAYKTENNMGSAVDTVSTNLGSVSK